MSIILLKDQDKIIIKVLGGLTTAEEEEKLLKEVENTKGQSCEVSFYDARVLSKELLVQFSQLIEKGYKLKFKAFQRFLASYLHLLSLPLGTAPSFVSSESESDFKAIAIGGSAGSLDKIIAIIKNLPASDMVVFIVQHISEDKINLLDQLLQQQTDMRVVMPQNMTKIQPGTIYVAPPARHMKVSGGYLYLTQDAKVNYLRPSISELFESLAYEYGAHLVAVLVCGYGDDGVKQLQLLKEKSATIIVENSGDCEAKDLTEAGLKSGFYDYELKISGICLFLASVASKDKEATANQAVLLLEAIYESYGQDLRGYRPETIQNRINNVMQAVGSTSFFEFQKDLLVKKSVYESFYLNFSIPVSGFFRHPEQFKLLRTEIFPYLDSFPKIKIWSAGCAEGEEPYSLAILLDEMGLLEKTEIFASDLNPYLLKIAKNGLFSKKAIAQGAENYKKSGGTKDWNQYFEEGEFFSALKTPILNAVSFNRHSLIQEGQFAEFHLILCRNVIIYFTPECQQKVIQLFSASLHRNGYLMLGVKEGLEVSGSNYLFNTEFPAEKTYRWNRKKRVNA
ncbi:MAG: CheR family methyltransferase [SAR324 cluster bacterium]|nr:CheR family methyltransferase [SAR324 cluster bacterium]